MSLRLLLLLGYGYLVGLLLLAAGSATLGFLRLSAGIDVVLEDNFRSIQASMRMIEALERQDSETLAGLLEGERADREALAAQEMVFLEALGRAEGNVTEEDETAILGRIRRDFDAFRTARDALLASPPERPLVAYNERVFPAFSAVKADLLGLLEINQDAMAQAEREARARAIQNGAWLGFLVVLALLSLIVLSRVLQRQVLSRLTELREGVEAIAAGQTGRRLRETGRDELTLIARRINALLDRAQRLEARMGGRVAEERRFAIALVEALDEEAALFGLDGHRMIGRLPEGEAAIREWIQGTGRSRLANSEEPLAPVRLAETPGGPVELRPLLSGTGRPLGWLARRA